MTLYDLELPLHAVIRNLVFFQSKLRETMLGQKYSPGNFSFWQCAVCRDIRGIPVIEGVK